MSVDVNHYYMLVV